MSASSFPAQVEAIVFSDSIRLSAIQGMKWGNWNVAFDVNGAEARYQASCGDKCGPGIAITGLLCRNPVLGGTGCRMDFLADSPRPRCILAVQNPEVPLIGINCPRGILLR
jgi:hypothetical protein